MSTPARTGIRPERMPPHRDHRRVSGVSRRADGNPGAHPRSLRESPAHSRGSAECRADRRSAGRGGARRARQMSSKRTTPGAGVLPRDAGGRSRDSRARAAPNGQPSPDGGARPSWPCAETFSAGSPSRRTSRGHQHAPGPRGSNGRGGRGAQDSAARRPDGRRNFIQLDERDVSSVRCDAAL